MLTPRAKAHAIAATWVLVLLSLYHSYSNSSQPLHTLVKIPHSSRHRTLLQTSAVVMATVLFMGAVVVYLTWRVAHSEAERAVKALLRHRGIETHAPSTTAPV